MFRGNYTDEERKTFHNLRYHDPDPRLMRRFDILWLYSCGKQASEIAPPVKQHVRTVRAVLKMYASGGIALVSTIDSHRPKSELEKHRRVRPQNAVCNLPIFSKSLQL